MSAERSNRPRLLLVDDEPANIKVLANALGQDYALSFATSGEEALRIAAARPQPDMILLDVFMMGMDGFQVCSKLKSGADTAEIPVIFVTALDDRVNEGRGLQQGAVDYIHKPLEPAVVKARVKMHLELESHREFLSILLKRRTNDLHAAHKEVSRAVDALHESERSFRNLIEGSIQGIVIQRDWKPLFANDAFARTLGYASPDEVLALGSMEPLFAPHERERLRQYGDARKKGDEAPTHYEFDAVSKDGATITLQSIVSTTYWRGVPASQVAVIDISERKRAEQALRESRERFRDYAESSSDWWWETGPDLRFTYISERGRRLLGVSSSAAVKLTQLGESAFDMVTDAAGRRIVKEYISEKKPFRGVEVPTRDSAGAIRYVRVSGKPLWGPDGEFRGYRGAATEVTDIVESQRQATMLRNAMDHASDGVALVGGNRRIVFTNDAFHEAFRELPAKNQIATVSVDELVRLDARAGGAASPFASIFSDARDGAGTCATVDLGAIGGEEIDASGRTYLLRKRVSDDGDVLMLYSDITERKEAERRLEKYQTELRRLAAKVSLAEERERRRIAAELHDGAVQHLGLTRVKLGTLRAKLAKSGGNSEVDEIVDLVDRAIREVRTLMAELSTSMLYELGLDPALEWLASRFEASQGLSCSFCVEGEPAALSTDVKVTVFQTVRELLVNVGKHASASRAYVEAAYLPGELKVRVRDDGVGIASERLALHPSGAGGFGLFSARERVAALGGRMSVDNASGTTVTLVVPVGDDTGTAAGR